VAWGGGGGGGELDDRSHIDVVEITRVA